MELICQQGWGKTCPDDECAVRRAIVFFIWILYNTNIRYVYNYIHKNNVIIYSNIGQSNGELRLAIDGLAVRGITAGRLQIYLNGQWGNICNGGFGIEEANVACHQLGYDRALSYSSATSDG